MSINWDEIDKQDAAAMSKRQQYKQYAPNGTYKVIFAGVEITDNPNWKSPRMVFSWAEDNDYKYPKSAAHWLSIGNETYRVRHNQNILVALGIEKAKARQLLEAAEKDTDRAKLVQAYGALYKRVAERKPSVEIEVRDQYRDGKPVQSAKGTTYSESDFTSFDCRVGTSQSSNQADPLADAEEVSGLGDIF